MQTELKRLALAALLIMAGAALVSLHLVVLRVLGIAAIGSGVLVLVVSGFWSW